MGRAWCCHIELRRPRSKELGEAVSRDWKPQKLPVAQLEKEEVRQQKVVTFLGFCRQ